MSVEIIIFIIKFVGVSAALMMIYLMLFKAKASFRVQRVFLLLLPIVAFFAAIVSVDYIEIAKIKTITNIINTSQIISESFAAEADEAKIVEMADQSQIVISFKEILCVVYGLVSLVMLVILFLGIKKINNFKKLATKQRCKNTMIYRCGLIETPFSFWRSIFIDRKIDGEKYDLVVRHELAHIHSLHFIDKIIVEIYLILFWFNPFIWSIRRELGLVHEFESDSRVISENCDIKLYKKFLFDEVVNNTPSIANGFNNSLIKQRFIQMKSNYKVRYKGARIVLTIPLIVCLMLLTSFTYVKEAEVSEKIESSIDNLAELIIPSEDTILNNLRRNIVVISDKKSEKTEVIINNTIKIESTSTRDVITIEKNSEEQLPINIEFKDSVVAGTFMPVNNRVEIPWYEHPMCYELQSYQYNIYKRRNSEFKTWVYRRDDHTQVDILCRISSNIGWTIISSNFVLIDPQSGDRYMVQSIKNDIPFDKTLVIRGQKGNTVLFSLIFPPLAKHIKRVNLEERLQPESFIPDRAENGSDNADRWVIKRVKVLTEN